MIKVKDFKEEFINLYSPDDKLISRINKSQMLDIQCQICENNLTGYYLISDNGIKSIIDKNGELDNFEDGLFDTHYKLLLKLKHLQSDKNI